MAEGCTNLEPIAIVGMACRFPGCSDLASFWQNLLAGVDCTTECPPGAKIGRVGQLYEDTTTCPDACRFGAFLTDIDQFDAEFFRISPSEAEFLDPQQRMMLETSWQALENAGIDPEGLRASSASVFAGMSNNDYRYLILGGADTSQAAASLYTITGTSLNTAIGRVSYALGLEGPAMTLDTACSSSLVAIHQAACALRREETDIALAGGVQLVLSGKLTELRANAGMLSPDGTCKTFDARANGYVRGEGCGMVVLKRLEDAKSDGDHIWALVASTAINQDGTSEGLTVPRGKAQKAVIAQALSYADVQASEVDYLEAHGTGTPVGDPIEINAAAEVYGVGREAESPLLIGSVKTNMGHLEPAAGVAGVIKTALALRMGVIPRHLNFETPNPSIDWQGLPVEVVTEARSWPVKAGKPRYAGINSFGFSGTNAHVLLKGYGDPTPGDASFDNIEATAGPATAVNLSPVFEPVEREEIRRGKRLLPVSAKSPAALKQVVRSYQTWLKTQLEQRAADANAARDALLDFSWTASVGRSHFNHRTGLVFEDSESLLSQLEALQSADLGPSSTSVHKLAFTYTGQGSQWFGMGRTLYESEPVFRRVIDRCEEVIREDRNESLIDRLFASMDTQADLEDPSWVQPAIYALQCALTDLWRSLGVQPQVVLGHSLGEIAAARTAGVWSLEDGLKFAAARGRLMSQLPGPGAMAAVFLGESDVQEAVDDYNCRQEGVGISIAAFNGAHQVLSGLAEELDPLLESLEAKGTRVRRLKKSPAYHSALVEPILDDLAEVIAGLDISPPTLDLVSNVSGELLKDGVRMDSDYWRRHARMSVAYRRSVQTLSDHGVDAVLEIGPNSVLGPMTQLAWPEDSGQALKVFSSLKMPRDDRPEIPADGGFIECLSEAYTLGLEIRFQGLYVGEQRRKLVIPGYAFQRRRHWVETTRRKRRASDHPLLGARHETPRGETLFESQVSASDPSWLSDHRVFDRLLMPGAYFGSLAIAASGQAGEGQVDEMQLHNPMVFHESAEDEPRQLQMCLEAPNAQGSRGFEIFSKGSTDDEWLLHAAGSISQAADGAQRTERKALSRLVSDLSEVDVAAYYKAKSEANINLGPKFRTLKRIWAGSGQAVAEISLDEAPAQGIDVPPLLLDGGFQVLSAARNSLDLGVSGTYIPFAWGRLRIHAAFPSEVRCHAQMARVETAEGADAETQAAPEAMSGDLYFYDQSGRLLGELIGFTVKRATRSALLSALEDPEELLYKVLWRNLEHPMSLRAAHPLVKLPQLESEVEPFFNHLREQGVQPEERFDLLMDLEQLAHAVVGSAFYAQLLQNQSGTSTRAEALMESMGVQPVHAKLMQRMLRMLEEAELLEKSEDGGYVSRLKAGQPLPERLADPQRLAGEFLEKHAHGQVELSLLSRFGAHLKELLTGAMDPLVLLFPDQGLGAADLYRVAPVSIAGNGLLAEVIARIVRDLPDDRPLRIIEVGAGTGATTEIVFAELSGTCLEYTFTDISAGFFSEAEQRFAGNGLNIDYRALDIETDPTSQGFVARSYDLVIAANVLHATQDLNETLTHCLELLVPGGLLVALESLRGRAWQDLTFGFLDGWWRFDDDYREHHALAGPEIWHRALGEAGFEDSLVFGGETISETSGPLGSGTIVARASQQLALPAGTWIIEPDAGEVAKLLRETLTACGQNLVFSNFAGAGGLPAGIPAEESVSHEELAEFLGSLSVEHPLRGVIHLPAIEGPGAEAGTEALSSRVREAAASALSLVQILMDSGVTPSHGISFITRGAQVIARERSGELAGAALWGLGKVVALEAPHLIPRMIDMDPEGESAQSLLHEILWPDEEDHVALRGESRWTARLVSSGKAPNQLKLPEFMPWLLSPGQEGSLQDLQILPAPSQALEARQVRVQVQTTALNFSDVLVALGAQTPGASLGLEFAGRIVELGSQVDEFAIGDRVLGMGFGTFGPEAVTHADLVAGAPEDATFCELATIPIVFTTAAFAFELGKLASGDRVLIHAGAGGVGLAAIQLARAAGAEVFATASRPKHAFLRSMGIEHVFDSRTLAFGDEILAATSNKGVDLVLNSLTGEGFIDTSLKCLGENGRFIEIGRLDILTHEQMSEVRPDVDYHILSLDELKRSAPERVGKTFRKLMDDFSIGELAPLIHTKWPILEAAEALQYMGSARHIGKVVLTLPALVDGSLKHDRSYLITGGLGGIGCAVADWLAERGAGHIVLNGRRAPDEAAEETLRELERRGVKVAVMIADISDPKAVDGLLRQITECMPPLAGIVHSVGVLSDASIPNQSWERFEEVLWPKILGAWHLHQSTRHLDLDLFMLFSSATGVLGNAGQANHAAANAFLDQLAAHRRSLGLAGQSIAWGAWANIGEAAEHRERIANQLESTGTGWIAPELGIKTLEHIISHDLLSPAAISVDWKVFEQHHARRSPFFKELLATSDEDADLQDDAAGLQLDALRESTVEERLKVLVPYLQGQLQSVLRLNSPPSPSVGFFDLGMDSLMAVELRNRLIRVFEGDLTISRTAVFDFPTVEALASHLSDELGQGDGQVESRGDLAFGVPAAGEHSEIAVVGMACRFPGAEDINAFWQNLEAGVESVAASRAESEKFKGMVGDVGSQEAYLRNGGYVDAIDQFDAKFFRIRPIEARMMDPRQRFLLETCWEALESAAIDPETLRGGRVGVYVGLGASEYRDMVNAGGYADSFLGTSSGMTTGRIAYAFGFMGPAISFDLACASSLVAIHQGVAALQRGEVDLAIVGGANAILSPAIMRFHREIGLLSANGHCRAFDADADGYVRGEGCGLLVLKRLDEAAQSGDPIWSLIRSSAVNQSGASAGLTVPNGYAQEQLIREAVSKAGVAPGEVDFLEAHGTGLLLSDPIEVRAAAAVYAQDRDPSRPLLLGSVKGNIGHLEWAAGVAGVIKTILSMHYRRLPPQLHYQRPNDQIEWDNFSLRVNSTLEEWPDTNGRAPLAAVSAFGMSGTNAHLLLEGYAPASEGSQSAEGLSAHVSSPIRIAVQASRLCEVDDLEEASGRLNPRRARLLPLSGMTPTRVADLAKKYMHWLEQQIDGQVLAGEALDDFLADLAWSSSIGRHHFQCRKGVVFQDLAQLQDALKEVAEGLAPATDSSQSQMSKPAFSFTSADSELFGFGQALYEREPLVRAILDQCAAQYLQSEQVDLLDAMFNCQGPGDSAKSEHWFYPAVYAMQVALASYWESLGIEPSVLLGAGVGEVAAATLSGVVSLEGGLEVVTRLAGAQSNDQVNFDALAMDGPKVAFVSAQRGGVESSEDVIREGFSRLDFEVNELGSKALGTLADLGVDCVLEIGRSESVPQAISKAYSAAKNPEPLMLGFPSDAPEMNHGEAQAKLIASAYEAGVDLRFQALFAGESRRKLRLPTYAFERRRYWFSDPL